MMARVTIALRDLHHAGAHRIEMYVADEFQKIFVFLTMMAL